MLARTQLLRVQKELYLKLKDCAKQFFGGLTPEMRRYYREYSREFSNVSSLSIAAESLPSEMSAALESAQIAIFGDYHTLSQAQRTVIHLTRELLPTLENQKRKLVIGLELASPEHDPILRKFVAGRLSEEALFKGLDFERRWGFPRENYLPLFQFAEAHQISLVGISPSRRVSLEERDRFTAELVARHSARDPSTLLLVMMGDLHLASAHLPRALNRALEKKNLQRDLVVIHQNNEALYWELAELGLDDRINVLKIREGVFCVFNTPPWVKLQSHLKWAELISEQEASNEEGERSWSEALNEVDHVEEVNGLLISILTFLRLNVKEVKGLANRFSVHGPDSREQILSTLDRFQFNPTEIKRLREYLGAFQSVYVPRASYLCLEKPSLNHEARLAAIFLHASLSGFERVFTDPRSDFYRFVMVEALGFFGSKVINPQRKSRGFDDLHRFLSDKIKDADARKVARFCLEHWDAERCYLSQKREHFPDVFRRQKSFHRSALLSYKASKVLGKALGEAFYAAVIDGKLDRKQMSKLFYFDFSELDPKEALALYLRWAGRLDRLGYRLRKSPAYGKK